MKNLGKGKNIIGFRLQNKTFNLCMILNPMSCYAKLQVTQGTLSDYFTTVSPCRESEGKFINIRQICFSRFPKERERGKKEVMSCIERGREEEREPRLYWAQNGSLCVVARMLKGTG